MISKNDIQCIKSIGIKKYRQLHKTYIVEGVKIIEEYLKEKYPIEKIYCTNEWFRENENIIGDIAITLVTNDELKKISQLTTPNKVLGIIRQSSLNDLTEIDIKNNLVLALSDIRDPGNLGTIIRIADWFGIEHIICSEDSVDVYNPKVIQASMASIIRTKVYYTNLKEFISKQKDISIFGTVLNGENIYTKNLRNAGIILMGNEANGISKELLSLVTDKISIPPYYTKYKQKTPNSLNISIATGIICAEFRRDYYIKSTK